MPSIRKGLSIAALLLVSIGTLFIQDTHAVEVRNKLMKSLSAKNLAQSENYHAAAPHHKLQNAQTKINSEAYYFEKLRK